MKHLMHPVIVMFCALYTTGHAPSVRKMTSCKFSGTW